MASNSNDPSAADDDEYQAGYEDDEDDERTIEEEEQLNSEDEENELNDLQADADMPLEELLKMYRQNAPERPYSPDDDDDDSSETEKQPHRVHGSLQPNGQTSLDDNDDDDDASDSSFEPEIIKVINVGDEYQAKVELSAEFDKTNGHDDDRQVPVDELLWSRSSENEIDDETIDNYLKTIHDEYPSSDDEISLQTLMQCQLDTDRALNQIRQLPVKTNYPYGDWSAGEIEQFEEGLREFGKNFYKISVSKCSNRNVREIVHFYYQWKKTERYQRFMEEQQQLNRLDSMKDMIEKLIEGKEQQLCTAVGVINSAGSSTTYLSNEYKRQSPNSSISFVTIHQTETLKRSYDQVDHDNEPSAKKSTLNPTNASTSTTTIV